MQNIEQENADKKVKRMHLKSDLLPSIYTTDVE